MLYTAFESPLTNLHHFAAPTNTTELSSIGQIMSLGHEPHNSDAVFGRQHRRTSLAQIVSQISANTFELVKPVINSGKG
ncbi:hypothetical protein EVAR_70881_1 [Eumeta japonica]|uniref:Uncharacterized protein n=1 Tax=Eumeta variegata TaxID=151549 RepID=A0A4C2AEH3_EUMVA|nr:hypothetical protein EVAR_70881_1 [Eumeta japonica]